MSDARLGKRESCELSANQHNQKEAMKLTVEQLDEIAQRTPQNISADELAELVRLAKLGIDVEDGEGAPMPMIIP